MTSSGRLTAAGGVGVGMRAEALKVTLALTLPSRPETAVTVKDWLAPSTAFSGMVTEAVAFPAAPASRLRLVWLSPAPHSVEERVRPKVSAASPVLVRVRV